MPMHATVLTGRNNIFDVLVDGSRYLCRLKGKTLRLDERSYNPLAPGDLVSVSNLDSLAMTGIIDRRLERRNAFERYNRKREALQTLAANIDLVVAVVSATKPAFRSRFVDRVLVLAEFHGVPAALVVTKADLDEAGAAREAGRYSSIGYPSLVVRHDDPDSIAAVADLLDGRRSVLVGQSGVGKSTLLNRLGGREIQRTGEISGRYLRGRHTTNAAVMIAVDRAEIVDTPGIRELDCRHVPREDLDWQFLDFREFLGGCDLGACLHAEEPGCAVRSAVERGALDAARYESYLRLSEELADLQEDYP